MLGVRFIGARVELKRRQNNGGDHRLGRRQFRRGGNEGPRMDEPGLETDWKWARNPGE